MSLLMNWRCFQVFLIVCTNEKFVITWNMIADFTINRQWQLHHFNQLYIIQIKWHSYTAILKFYIPYMHLKLPGLTPKQVLTTVQAPGLSVWHTNTGTWALLRLTSSGFAWREWAGLLKVLVLDRLSPEESNCLVHRKPPSLPSNCNGRRTNILFTSLQCLNGQFYSPKLPFAMDICSQNVDYPALLMEVLSHMVWVA